MSAFPGCSWWHGLSYLIRVHAVLITHEEKKYNMFEHTACYNYSCTEALHAKVTCRRAISAHVSSILLTWTSNYNLANLVCCVQQMHCAKHVNSLFHSSVVLPFGKSNMASENPGKRIGSPPISLTWVYILWTNYDQWNMHYTALYIILDISYLLEQKPGSKSCGSSPECHGAKKYPSHQF